MRALNAFNPTWKAGNMISQTVKEAILLSHEMIPKASSKEAKTELEALMHRDWLIIRKY